MTALGKYCEEKNMIQMRGQSYGHPGTRSAKGHQCTEWTQEENTSGDIPK